MLLRPTNANTNRIAPMARFGKPYVVGYGSGHPPTGRAGLEGKAVSKYGIIFFQVPSITELIVLSIAMGTLCGIIAFSRGRLALAWFFLGFLFSFFALILILALPSPKRAQNRPFRARMKVEPPKICAHCGASNSQAFRSCAKCGEPFKKGTITVEVHHFKVWNNRLGDWEISPSKRTAKAIAEANGVVIQGTMEMVSESALDSHGRYFPIGDNNVD